jgi:AhpD family alkylhydroperoxidase
MATEARATEARMEYAAFDQLAPAATAAMAALGKAVAQSGLDRSLIELIKVRGSQVNGCAYCLQFHLNAARRAKVPETKLGLVAVWRDAGVFSAREKAALAWTEALTHVTPAGVDDPTYNDVANEFTESELAFLTVAIATINAWNRIAMTYRFTPPIPQDEATG